MTTPPVVSSSLSRADRVRLWLPVLAKTAAAVAQIVLIVIEIVLALHGHPATGAGRLALSLLTSTLRSMVRR
jgi:hypothetical protein